MGFQPDRPPKLARTRASPADAAGPPTADIVSNELAIASVDQEDGILLVVEDRIVHPVEGRLIPHRAAPQHGDRIEAVPRELARMEVASGQFGARRIRIPPTAGYTHDQQHGHHRAGQAGHGCILWFGSPTPSRRFS